MKPIGAPCLKGRGPREAWRGDIINRKIKNYDEINQPSSDEGKKTEGEKKDELQACACVN